MQQMQVKFRQVAGGKALYEGEVFREGVYAERGITVTADQIDFLAKTTGPGVPIKIEHQSTPLDSALDGFGLESIEAQTSTDGKRILWARISIPQWLYQALGDEFKVSIGFLYPSVGDASGFNLAIGEISIVEEPRVASARVSLVASLFSKLFAGRRNSGGDQTILNQILALLKQLGAEDSEPDGDEGSQRSSAGEGKPQMNLIEKLKGYFSSNPEVRQAAGITEEELAEFSGTQGTPQAPVAQATTTPSPAATAVTVDFAQHSAQVAALQSRLLMQSAEAFAKDVIYTQRRAKPVQKDSLIQQFVAAVKADSLSAGQMFSASGDVVEGDAVKGFKAFIAGLPQDTTYQPGAISDAVRDVSAGSSQVTFNAGAAIEMYNKGGR